MEASQLEKENQGGGHVHSSQLMSYGETLIHMLKGNIGPGAFSMGDAFKNGGIILSPILTLFISLISVHNQHILVDRSRKMHQIQENSIATKLSSPDFAETVGLCFENGPPKFRVWSKFVKLLVNFIICFTQLGFCCILFVFISSSAEQFWKIHFVAEWSINIRILLILLPIVLLSCITNLKHLAPVSGIANICVISGLALTLYYMLNDLPDIRKRRYVGEWQDLPLFLGTTVYSFEGIAMVLPLRNIMSKPKLFSRPAGVLNVGMVVVTTLLTCCGFFGYWRFGEETKGNLALNLPESEALAQIVKLMVAAGGMLSYPLQFFVAIQVMWSAILARTRPLRYPIGAELLFRILFVLFTFTIAELVPLLSLVISLVGSMCSTTLALLIPPVIELVSEWGVSDGLPTSQIIKNFIIILIGIVCFVTGTYESIRSLVIEIARR